MSYDPRRGSSPYLGMDNDETTVGGWDAQADETTVGSWGAGADDTTSVDDTSWGVPATTYRPARAPQRAVAPVRGQQAGQTRIVRPVPQPAPRAVPSPEQQPYQAEPLRMPHGVGSRLSGPLTTLTALAFWLAGFALRLAAIALAGVVVASAVLTDAHRVSLVEALNLTTTLMPPVLLGRLVYETPFGGAMRGDLMVASLVLFFADWLCVRHAAALRQGRTRGV